MRKLRYLIVMMLISAVSLAIHSEAYSSITTPLQVYSSNRHYLVNNGTPVVFLGAGQPLPGHKSNNYRAEIDALAAHKVNYARVWHLIPWDATNAYFPWARDGGGTAKDGLPKYNLTHWDSTFWSRMKDMCAYAQSKNIYLGIMLFDECGIEAPQSAGDHRWDWHPFNPANNVNGLSLPTTGSGVPSFYNLSNSTLKSLQEAYVSKMITETSQYPNVTYEICNEYTSGWDWESYWIGYLNSRCSNLITVNRLGTGTPAEYWTDSRIDMVKVHWSTMAASTINSYMVGLYPKNRAVNYDETLENSSITYTDYRKATWSMFVGGGHIHLENGGNVADSLDALLHQQNFIQSNEVKFWEMAPNNSLVTATPGGSAYTLAKTGSEYVVYIVGSGSGSMTMNLPTGTTFTAKAYNPSTGAYTNLTVSGTKISGIPSYSSDIVVYVKAGTSTSPPVSGSPGINLAIAADKTNAKVGDTITYTLTYKNTGTANAQSVSISSPVSSYLTYTTGSASSSGTYSSTARTVTWSISSIAPGVSGTLTYKVTVN
ncbi:MAG: DUF6298 domain-containing protein [Armatimonadota bacterium]